MHAIAQDAATDSTTHPARERIPASDADTTQADDALTAAQLAAALHRLDPDAIAAEAVRDVLSQVPAPTLIALNGSLPLLTMQSVTQFLIAMGYPERALRDPATGALSYSSFRDSAALAGVVAWHYEQEGVMPILVGHSQGGMQVIRVLHEFDGRFHDAIPVRRPGATGDEGRTFIVDPLSGKKRSVVGLRIGFAAAIATGKLPRILLGQWDMIPLLRKIPETAEEFTGYTIEWDAIAGTFPGSDPYRAMANAEVHNVVLRNGVTHLGAIALAPLAQDPAARQWIERYRPNANLPLPEDARVDTTNILLAADLWHRIKKHWRVEAERLLLARSVREPR